jgi:hypothetical protein
MSLQVVLQRLVNRSHGRRRFRPRAVRPRAARLLLESLEERTLLSSYTASSVRNLIADIHLVNQAGGSNTIVLAAGHTFTLMAVDNSTDGATGLPVIAANDNLTIIGNGDTIARSSASGTPAFRLLDIVFGASLTLEDLTLEGGLVQGAGIAAAAGGGIFNQGALVLSGVTVRNNTAQGHPASGGGIWSSGALTLEGGSSVENNLARATAVGTSPPSPNTTYGGGVYIAGGTATLADTTLSSNTAQGNDGTVLVKVGFPPIRVPAGSGYGGGLYVAAGSVTLQGDTLDGNEALGGKTGPWLGSSGGNGFGGGLYAAGGTVTLREDTVDANAATGGAGSALGAGGLGEGGGIYIDTPATAYLDAFTMANVINNTALTSYPNIDGSYTII